MRKEILGLIIVCVLLFICFGVGYNRGKKSVDIQTDTVKIEKVITEYKPSYKGEIALSTQKIKVPLFAVFPEQNDDKKIDSLYHIIDSLKLASDSLEVELQRVQRHYKTDNYEAWVSGIEPELDSIKVKQQITYVTNTQVIENDKFCLNVGLNTTGLFNRSYTMTPNINIAYTWNRITFTGETGIDIPLNTTPQLTPYFQFGINYSLFSF